MNLKDLYTRKIWAVEQNKPSYVCANDFTIIEPDYHQIDYDMNPILEPPHCYDVDWSHKVSLMQDEYRDKIYKEKERLQSENKNLTWLQSDCEKRINKWTWKTIGNEVLFKMCRDRVLVNNKLNITIPRVPLKLFEEDILRYNNTMWPPNGIKSEKLSLIKTRTGWSSKAKNGHVPYLFLCFRINKGKRIKAKNKNTEIKFEIYTVDMTYTKNYGKLVLHLTVMHQVPGGKWIAFK